uniref:Uncharacterized protein n=1 Tax=viral metagenome TaxID=1070528 RepID=A0A6H1ZXB7_9ZZZZ
MPRLRLEDGSTMDFCHFCWDEGILIEDYPDAELGIDHPRYEDEDFYCEACGDLLGEDD